MTLVLRFQSKAEAADKKLQRFVNTFNSLKNLLVIISIH